LKNAEGMISQRNQTVWAFASGFEIELPMRDVGLQFSLPGQRAATWEDRSARLSLILSSISTLGNRFPTGLCSMFFFELRGGLRTNTAFLV
jgi:hypothetical protein